MTTLQTAAVAGVTALGLLLAAAGTAVLMALAVRFGLRAAHALLDRRVPAESDCPGGSR